MASGSTTAIVPGYSHYNFQGAPEVPQIIEKFLTDSFLDRMTGAAAASQVS